MFAFGLAVGVLIIILSIALYIKQQRSDGSNNRPAGGGGAPVAPAGGRRRAAGGARMRRPIRAAAAEQDEDEGGLADELEELEEAGVKIPEGKIGKKKLEKLQNKADKKLAREAEERDREERKQREKEEEAKREAEREAEKLREEKEEEEERRKKEEKEKREYEEYLKLKASFDVQEEGFDVTEEENQENMLEKFITYIKQKKVVLLEDLAAHFKMKTQDTIDRIQTLQSDGLLTGVIDDRGKFIYVSKEELQAVAKFIKQRGRVSIADLAESSNKLINLNPEPITT